MRKGRWKVEAYKKSVEEAWRNPNHCSCTHWIKKSHFTFMLTKHAPQHSNSLWTILCPQSNIFAHQLIHTAQWKLWYSMLGHAANAVNWQLCEGVMMPVKQVGCLKGRSILCHLPTFNPPLSLTWCPSIHPSPWHPTLLRKLPEARTPPWFSSGTTLAQFHHCVESYVGLSCTFVN